ncbi:hypothetical protein, partial [Desulfovibrio sp.]|uniref:hypothetical protein n=1 Tax=Desulfovibrio sp. TaxID=885 RepID=UPI003FEE5A80
YIQLKVAMLPLLKTAQEKGELLVRLDELRRGLDKSLNSRDAIELKVKLAEYTADPEKRADLLHEAEALASEALRSSSEDKTSQPFDTLGLYILYADIKEKMVEYAATPQERDALLHEAESQLAEAVRRSPDDAYVLCGYADLKAKMAEHAATPQERNTLLREADDYIAEALRRSPDDVAVLLVGTSIKTKLVEYAATPQERDGLLREAEGLLAEELRRFPDDVDVLSVGALIKTKLAEYAATPQERDGLLREAEGHLAEAVRCAPTNIDVLIDCAIFRAVKVQYAETSQERDALLREAKELLKKIPLRSPRMFLQAAKLEVQLAKYAVPQERKTLLGNAEMHIKQSGQEKFPQ